MKDGANGGSDEAPAKDWSQSLEGHSYAIADRCLFVIEDFVGAVDEADIEEDNHEIADQVVSEHHDVIGWRRATRAGVSVS